jgi:hypothetical protein
MIIGSIGKISHREEIESIQNRMLQSRISFEPR